MSLRTRTFALLSLSALALFVASCGGGAAEGPGTAAPTSVALVRLLDTDTPVVIHIDADSLRQSPYYTLVHDALLNTLGDHDASEFRRIVQLLDRTDHVVLGLNPVQRGGVVLLRGTYNSGDLDLIEAPGGQFTHRNHALRGNERTRGVVTPDTMVIGSTESVLRALDRLDGLAPATGPTLAGFAEAAARVHLGESDVSAVVLLTAELRERMGHGDVESALRESGLSAGGSLDARNGIRVSGFFTASSEGAVQLLASQLREALADVQGDMTVAMLGLSVLVRQIQIEERGTDLLVELRLDDAQVRELIERFGPLLQAVLSMT